ncbi:MAG: hypothetical protein ABFC57_18665 [Veillonellales bacterium]
MMEVHRDDGESSIGGKKQKVYFIAVPEAAVELSAQHKSFFGGGSGGTVYRIDMYRAAKYRWMVFYQSNHGKFN